MKKIFPGRRPLLIDEGYRGPLKKKPYFEGWYFRQVSADQSRSLAVIVGLSLQNDPHAFIQILFGPTGTVLKKRYPLDALCARRDRFEVTLGENSFSTEAMELHIDGPDGRLDGRLQYTNRVPLAGIMGPFAFVPFMECIHGALSVDHQISGVLEWNGELVSFDGGRGYIEKDRGRSMPSSWVWVQTNQFKKTGDSLMFSVARIPWLGRPFTGHLGYLFFDGKMHRFATYTGSRITADLENGTGKGTLNLRFTDRFHSLDIRLSGVGKGGALLDAPVNGAMSREIVESSEARMDVVFSNCRGEILWNGSSPTVSAEVVGDISELF